MFKRFFSVFLVLLCLGVAGHSAAKSRDPLLQKLPNLEVIPEASWFWVSERMARNGVPMTIKMFAYSGASEEVEKYYRDLWKTKGHGKTHAKTVGDLKILTNELDGFIYSVQFAQKGGVVEGKLVVTPTPLNAKYSKKSTIAVPPRSEIANKIESLDGTRRSETLNIESRLRVPQIVDFYRAEFNREGWSEYGSSGDGRSGAVLSFQRGGELLQLTITGLQGRNSKYSEVLIHWIK